MIRTLYRKYILDDLPQHYLSSHQTLNCSKALLFHHIPKNAGTSFRDILTKNYSRTERLYFYGRPENIQSHFQTLESSNNNVRRIQCIATHKPKQWLKHLGSDFRAISFIRHPLARTISLYHYLLNIPENRKGGGGYRVAEAIREQNLSLEDIYDRYGQLSPQDIPNGSIFSGFFNGQYRHLLGAYRNVRQVPFMSKLSLDEIPFLREFQSILHEHYYLGLVEEFNASVDKMAGIFNWNVESYPYNLLGNYRKTKELSSSLEKKILSYNQIDMLLWELTRNNVLQEKSFELNWNVG